MIVNRRSIFFLRLLSDLVLLNAAFILAAVLAQSLDTLMERNRMFILEAALNFVWYFFTTTTNFYDDFTNRLFVFQIFNIIKNVIVQILCSIIFIFVVKEDLFTRNFIIYYSVLLFSFVSLRSLLFRAAMRTLRKRGINIRNILIVGTGEVAQNFKQLIGSNPDFGFRFAGFMGNTMREPAEILGMYDKFEEIMASNKIDEVVIALEERDNSIIDEIIKSCNRNAVRVHIIPDYFRFISKKFRVSMIGNFPVITSRNEPLNEIQWRFIKRTFDIIFSVLVLLFTGIFVFPFVAILTKSTSPGPIFFVQERIGTRNRKFKCYKFRTLKSDPDRDQKNFMPVTENDPRLIPWGKILRHSNLDELPQFFNVLRGDMSVVGPRPHAVSYDYKYGKFVDEIRLRHIIKPGITGWAQIHGLRGDVTDEEQNMRRTKKRIEYDLWYIENWSIWLDFQIIFITIWQMIKRDTKAV